MSYVNDKPFYYKRNSKNVIQIRHEYSEGR